MTVTSAASEHPRATSPGTIISGTVWLTAAFVTPPPDGDLS